LYSFVRKVLEDLHEDPDARFIFNSDELLEFAEKIQQAYWDETNYSPLMSREWVESTTNILQDNEVVGEWTDDYLDYNCYAYAIGYERDLQPGQLVWEEETQEFGTYVLGVTGKTVAQLAELVRCDLLIQGYVINTISTMKPNVVVSEHDKLICIRKDIVNEDYHLMRLDSDGYWYHKPGVSNPLKYTGVMLSSINWVLEGYGKLAEGKPIRYRRDLERTYSNAIFYISYSSPHTYTTYRYYGMENGIHKHVSVCSVCGGTSGPQLCMYKNGSDKCSLCNHHKYQAAAVPTPIIFETS
jgi:hypothetical protein